MDCDETRPMFQDVSSQTGTPQATAAQDREREREEQMDKEQMPWETPIQETGPPYPQELAQ